MERPPWASPGGECAMADGGEKSAGRAEDSDRKKRGRERVAGETAGWSYRASGLVQRAVSPAAREADRRVHAGS